MSELQIVSSNLGLWRPRLSERTSTRSSSARVLLSDTPYAWRDVVESALGDLIRLPDGWDGYRGAPVSFSNAFFALRMLESICSLSTEPPQLVPGSDGDLQIEWHTMRGDIEL